MKMMKKLMAVVLAVMMVVMVCPMQGVAGAIAEISSAESDFGYKSDEFDGKVRFTQISMGGSHSAGIDEHGSLWMWGNNEYGQLGNGTRTRSIKPIKIMDDVAQVSLGGLHSAAIKKDGSLLMWGWNEYGQLGNGTTTNSSNPIKIMDNVAQVSLGDEHSAAIKKDGSLLMWGWNEYGQLGNGTTTSSSKPIKIMDDVAQVSLGDYHSAAIKKDGSLCMWGYNEDGQLGDGTTNSSKPIKIMDNVAQVSLGRWHSTAIKKDGSLWMWGYNEDGQLGDGTTNSSNPIKIMDNVAQVSLGDWHSAAIKKDGSLLMWGNNEYGQLGDGTTTSSNKPICISQPDNTPTNEQIKVGLDSSSFGENIYAEVGEKIKLLVVYTSEENDIYSVVFMSDPEIEIGDIKIGSDMYVPKENEHVAEVEITPKKEGTFEFSAHTSTSLSAKVKVIAKDYSDFTLTQYRADKWLEPGSIHNNMINSLIYNHKGPSEIFYNSIRTDVGFCISLHGWEFSNAVNDPSHIYDDMLTKEKYYEAVLLSMIAFEYGEELNKDSTFSNATENLSKVSGYMADKFDEFGIINDSTDLAKYWSDADKAKIRELLTQTNEVSDKLGIGLDILSVLVTISKNFEEFNIRCALYETLDECSEGMKEMLYKMYENRKENNLFLRSAIENVINVVMGSKEIVLSKELAMTGLESMFDAVFDVVWGEIVKKFPEAIAVKLGLTLGIELSNDIYNTDELNKSYYYIECLHEIRELAVKSSKDLGIKYKQTHSLQDALAFEESIKCVHNLNLIDIKYMRELVDKIDSKLTNRIVFFKFVKSAPAVLIQGQKNVEYAYELVKNSWCYSLKDDHPAIYRKYASQMNLNFKKDLKYAKINVINGDALYYTGKEITPDIEVFLAGKKLEQGKDFKIKSYEDNVKIGLAKVYIEGIGEYFGTSYTTFVIEYNPIHHIISIVSSKVNNTRSLSDAEIIVYDSNDNIVAKITNGSVVKEDVFVIVDGDMVSIMLDDNEYRINISGNENINYSYKEYDDEYNEIENVVYNNIDITNGISSNITSENVEVFAGEGKVTPDFDSSLNNKKYYVNVVDGISSSETASENEWVYVSAIVPTGYRFIEWQSESGVVFADKSAQNTSFIMVGEDIEIKAVIESIFACGDASLDKEVNTYDASLILRYVAKLEEFTDVQLLASDVNRDGIIDASDATKILRYLAELETL